MARRPEFPPPRFPPQRLDRTLTCFRIGDPEGAWPIMDTSGSRLFPGRWNTPAAGVLYTARHYSLAMLEKLAHGAGRLPPNQHYVAITLPRGLSYEVFDPAALPGWDFPDGSVSARFGAEWQKSRRSAVLLVPSILARMEENVLLNPEHPDYAGISFALPRPVWWDKRLFSP